MTEWDPTLFRFLIDPTRKQHSSEISMTADHVPSRLFARSRNGKPSLRGGNELVGAAFSNPTVDIGAQGLTRETRSMIERVARRFEREPTDLDVSHATRNVRCSKRVDLDGRSAIFPNIQTDRQTDRDDHLRVGSLVLDRRGRARTNLATIASPASASLRKSSRPARGGIPRGRGRVVRSSRRSLFGQSE